MADAPALRPEHRLWGNYPDVPATPTCCASPRGAVRESNSTRHAVLRPQLTAPQRRASQPAPHNYPDVPRPDPDRLARGETEGSRTLRRAVLETTPLTRSSVSYDGPLSPPGQRRLTARDPPPPAFSVARADPPPYS